MRPMIAGAADLLDCEEVPPRGLAALVEVQLEAFGQCLLDLVLAQRRLGAGDAGDELAALGELLDRRAQDLLGLAPGDELVARIADGLARAEATLYVVARGGRHAAGRESRNGSPQRCGVVLGGGV